MFRKRQKRKGPNKFGQDYQEEDRLLLRAKTIFTGKEKKKKKDTKHPLNSAKSDIIQMHKTIADEGRVHVTAH